MILDATNKFGGGDDGIAKREGDEMGGEGGGVDGERVVGVFVYAVMEEDGTAGG